MSEITFIKGKDPALEGYKKLHLANQKNWKI